MFDMDERDKRSKFAIWRIVPSRCAALLPAMSRPAANIEMVSILAVQQHGMARQANGNLALETPV